MPPLHKTLVAVATYNERDNVPPLVEAIRQALPKTDILIIDDGSPDGTGQWCETQADEHEWFHLIQRCSKQGLGTATVRGMQFAIEHKYDLWIAMDADFSHPPEQLPKMVSTIGNLESPDFDCVIGSRYIHGGGVTGWPWFRRFMSRGVNLYARILLGLEPRDCSGAYRCCRVELLSQLDFSQFLSHGYSFMEEFLWRLKKLNVRIAEIPIIFTDREHGASKLNQREAIHSLWILFKLGLQNWLRKN